MAYIVHMGQPGYMPTVQLEADDYQEAWALMRDLAEPFQGQPFEWLVMENKEEWSIVIKPMFSDTHLGYIIGMVKEA